jgi:hypothetical protein
MQFSTWHIIVVHIMCSLFSGIQVKREKIYAHNCKYVKNYYYRRLVGSGDGGNSTVMWV